MKKVARTIRRYWQGVISAATSSLTNALEERLNARIQWIKKMVCGYRNRARFRTVIYFHLGGLNLFTDSSPFRTKS